jgi:exopolyphosphatase / guanosine-5'-triphosphate,3'-diphosphate pyrophosphatase
VTRLAGIDCGTNSIRLLVADVEGGVATDVVRQLRIVRLGQGVDRTGRLAADAIERTRVALAEYAKQIGELGAERVRMVATSATRDADNRQDFRAMVLATLGAEPEVISGAAEAALSFAGAVRGLGPDAAPPPYLVCDIGGGSTEIVFGTDSVEAARSVDVGCVRMTERHFAADPPTAAQVAAAEADIRAAIATAAGTVPLRAATTVVGLAGSVTTVAAIALDLAEYDQEAIHHSRIPAADVRRISARLLRLDRAERAAITVIHPGRVDVIAAGALVLRVLLDEVGAAEVVVSEHDILDGIVWSIA